MPRILRILFLETHAPDALGAVAHLREAGFDCRWEMVETREGFVEMLSAGTYDLVLAELILPAFSGRLALDLFHQAKPGIPFIFLTSTHGDDDPVECLKAGADDFLPKSQLFRLGFVVERALREVGERRELEQTRRALELSDHRYRTLLEEHHEHLLRLRPDGVILYANPSFCRARRTSFAREVGRSWLDSLATTERELFLRALPTLAADKPGFTLSHHRIDPDGGKRWEEWSFKGLFTPDGHLTEIQGLGRDITPMKQKEEHLREQGNRAELALQASELVVWDWDLAQDQLHLSDRWTGLLGQPPQPLTSTYEMWARQINPEDLPALSDALARHLAGLADFFDCEFRVRRGDGRPLWVVSRGRITQRDARGRSLRMTGTLRDITHFKELESHLRQSQNRYQYLVDTSPDGIFVLRDGRFLYANQALADLLGEDNPAAIVDSPLLRYLPESSREEVLARFRDLQEGAGGETRVFSLVLLSSEGRTLETEMAATRIEFSSQAACQVIVRDMTSRKAAETALSDVWERYRMATNAGQVGVWDWNLDEGLFHLDQSIRHILGYSVRELPDSPDAWLHLTLPETRSAFESAVKAYLGDPPGTPFEFERPVRRKDGGTTWLLTRGTIVGAGEGRRGRFTGTEVDITSSRLAAESLRENETLYRLLAENASDMISRHDPRGHVLYCSSAAVRLLGHEPTELVGQPFSKLVHPDNRTQFEQSFAEAVASENAPLSMVYRLRHRSGHYLWVETTAQRCLHFEHDSASGPQLVAITRDITLRREQQEQVSQAARLDSIGRLAGGVAHDFNNLLAVIKGFAELLLLNPSIDDAGKDYATKISQSADRGSFLTKRLLAFGKKQNLTLQNLDIGELLTRRKPYFLGVLGGKTKLRITPAPNLWKVRTDPGQIEQTVLNLLLNAAEAMPDGGEANLTLSNLELKQETSFTTGSLPPGRYVRIDVGDHGVGMDEDTLARVFDPFFSTKKDFGNGLGLSVVYGLVEQMNGAIQVVSNPGRGTEVSIIVPAVSETPSPASASPPGAVDLPDRTRPRRILIVEDNQPVRSLLAELLRSRGYSVTEAADGEEALEVLARDPGPFGFCLSDLLMPRLNGLDLARALMTKAPDLKICLLSGYPGESLKGEKVPANVVDFMPKPVDTSRLFELVDKAFATSSV
ncbi:MAG: PAS domain S-box protein [Puniceicoccaceae bacterium]|nr:MAG: PAS domain S-box protein [Puniceicoccaceae bacterium]